MRRILELDALRGITAVVIVLAHVGLMVDSPWVFTSVDLFFVLSGYFITTNVLKNGRTPGFLVVFFSRRALRIWPAYYLALAACLVLNRKLKWDAPPDALAYYLTFTQNVQDYFGWVSPRFSGMFKHTWTLAIEEQFYVLWPLLLFRARRRAVWGVVVGFAVLPALMRSLGYSPFLLLTRCDGLALGSLLAVLLSDRERVARHLGAYRAGFALTGLSALAAPVLLAPAVAGLTAAWPGVPWDRVGASLFTSRACVAYFGLAGLTLCLQGHPAIALLRDRRLCYVGQISYGLYLYHPLVFGALPGLYKRYVFRRLGLTSTLLMDLVMVALCFVLADLSRRLVEDPIVALKRRLTYKEKAPASAPSEAETSLQVYRGPHAMPVADGRDSRAERPALG